MAKQESKGFGANSKPRAPGSDPGRRHRHRELLLIAVVTSLVLSGLLTMDVLPTGVGGLIPRAREIADRSYKAPSDIRVVDEAATEAHRREAAEQAVLVYDFDERRWTVLHERVTAAFSEARAALLGETTEGVDRPEPARVFREALGEETEVADSLIERLAKLKFGAEPEKLLLKLISPIVARMVVDDASEFERQAEKRTIVVRELGSGTERVLTQKAAVLTLSAAGSLLRDEAPKVFADRPREERRSLKALAAHLVRPNLSFNLRASDEKRQAAEDGVKEVVIALRKGEIVVRDGDPVTERHVLILEGIQ